MKIVIQDPSPGEGDQIILKVKALSEPMLKALQLLKSPDDLPVFIDGKAYMLPIEDIFYVESMELKTFVYSEKDCYRSRLKLYELEETLGAEHFLRISKQVIVHIKKIKSISPAGGGRFQGLLTNGEKVIISRQYVSALKARFGL